MFIINDDSCSLVDCLKNLQSIEIFKNGKIKVVKNGSKDFNIIFANLQNLFSSAIIQPALAVSMNKETINALKTDNWIQLNFNTQLIKNDLEFTKLLFRLEETNGFNVIRYNKTYDGRCIFLYLDFSTNLNNLLLGTSLEN